MPPTGVQFDRSLSLLIANRTDALELSDLRIKFKTTASDLETPNTLVARIYNLSSTRVKELIAGPNRTGLGPQPPLAQWEFSKVQLSAGYGGNPGLIFSGTVKNFVRGKENNTDSYLEIRAADGDLQYNTAFINQSMPGGWTPTQQLEQLGKAAGIPVATDADSFLTIGGISPQAVRGKVMFGLVRAYMRDLANTHKLRWSIQNGQIVLIPNAGYRDGEIVKVNSTSGLVGVPEATEGGVMVTTLLNPAFQVGGRIQINESDVTQTQIAQQFFPEYTQANFVATVDQSTEGTYRIIAIECEADSRGQEWYSHLTCLMLDPSAPQDASVVGSF